jgi:hypothetical protein
MWPVMIPTRLSHRIEVTRETIESTFHFATGAPAGVDA